MKQARHQKICELIEEHNIETQEELANRLRQCGFSVTQATVSRDIKALKLIKTLSGDGGTYKYALTDMIKPSCSERKFTLSDAVVSINAAGNLLVIKTTRGAAFAVSEALRSMPHADILGDIAGFDTLFIAVSTPQAAIDVKNKLDHFIHTIDEED